MHRRSFITLSAKSLVGFGLLSALPLTAYAHKERSTLTNIVWDEEDQKLYITHSYHIHEAEQVLFKAGVLGKPDLYDLRTRAQLALYTQDNFAVMANGETPLALELLGAENSGRNCFVYQQALLASAPKSLRVTCALMRPLETDMINHVDMSIDGRIVSESFKGKDGPKLIWATS